MEKCLSILAIVIYLLYTSCIETPTFYGLNEIDPESEIYKPSKHVDFEYRTNYNNGFELEWRYTSNLIYDGFELYRSLGDTNNFERIYEGEEFSFSDSLPDNIIDIHYKLVAFFNQPTKRVSSDGVYISLIQNINSFRVIYDPPFMELEWTHNFELNSTLNIFKSIGNEPFDIVDSTTVYHQFYRERHRPNDTTRYKILVQNEFQKIELTHDTIKGDFYPPEITSIISENNEEIELSWDTNDNSKTLHFDLAVLDSAYIADSVSFSVPTANGRYVISGLHSELDYEMKVYSSISNVYSYTFYYQFYKNKP